MKKIFQSTDCLSLEILQSYIDNELSEEQKFRVENHLLDCPLCSEALDGMRLMEDNKKAVFEDLYQKINERIARPTVENRRRIFPWNSIAAGLLFFIIASAAYFYYQANRSLNNNYQVYFADQENSFAVRSIERNNFSKKLISGIEFYDQENYQASLSFFEDYLKREPETVEAAYYAGMSALQIGEREIAFGWLSIVRLNSDSLYEEATWRLAGIHLEKKEVEKAKALLLDLAKLESGIYVEKAEALSKELE